MSDAARRLDRRMFSGRGARCCLVLLTILFAACRPAAVSAGSCKLAKIAEFPITMTNLQPTMTAKINDVDVQFLVDSGAFYSIITPANAAELKLRLHAAPFGFYVTGLDGRAADVSVATVPVFTLAGVPLHDVDFLVGGGVVGPGSIGVLGQNVLHIADVEYDLGQGVVRLMKPMDCGKSVLAYWVGTTMPYSVISIGSTTPLQPMTTSSAFINGTEIRVMFDSGAGVSTLSLKAAARVGIKPDSPGVVYAGQTHGIGKRMIPSYIAPFSSFKIGEEEIRNTRLRIADIELQNADMLIGPDFFLSHRIYVSNAQRKLYFTYSGGPVFNLSGAKYPNAAAAATPEPASAPTNVSADAEPASGASAAAGPAPADGSVAAQHAPAVAPEDAQKRPRDAAAAADYSRRGEALASRRDFEQALANLTHACELAPDHAEYFYQRGVIHWQMRQVPAAMADLEQALKLQPDDVAALVGHAELSLQSGDKRRASADLDAAAAAAPKQADERFALAHLYQRADLAGPAITQYDLWIASHAEDARLPEALGARCWIRAIDNVDLPLALQDCSTALKRADKSSPLYAGIANSRGLVLLRMGEYDKSISDYDASLKIAPKNAWSWYGRGVDKLREHKAPEGESDIAQAKVLWPKVAEEFGRRGIVP